MFFFKENNEQPINILKLAKPPRADKGRILSTLDFHRYNDIVWTNFFRKLVDT